MGLLQFLIVRARGVRRLLGGSIAAGVVSGLASVSLLGMVNDSLAGETLSLPIPVGLAFAGLCVLVTVARVSSLSLLALLSQGVVKDLRLELSRRILATPLARLEDLGAHRLLASLTDDINSLTQALMFVPGLFINGSIVVGALAYLAWLDLDLFLMLLVAVAVGAVSYRLPVRLGTRRFLEAREEADVLFGHFRGLTEGIKELKLHRRRRSVFVGMVEATAEALRRLRVGATVIYGTAAAWGHLLFFVVIGLLLYARPSFVQADRGVLVGYTLVILYIMTPLQSLLDNFPILSRATVAVNKLQRLGLALAAEEQVLAAVARDGERAGDAPFQQLDLRAVTHAYQEEAQDLAFRFGPVDFALRPGELVFLVGGNGSGKTTLAKLLVGLYRPDDGEIRVDGRAVTEEDADDYRQLFSVVFSDFFLFERLLGLERPDLDQEARRYLDELGIAHKVRIEDGKLSTVDLSQGQRKRLAMLNAYLEDRAVYVFDEWAADQDPVFKEVFYREILDGLKRRGKAVVVISHDDRYYGLADRIVKLEEGRIEYEGPYEGAALAPTMAEPIRSLGSQAP